MSKIDRFKPIKLRGGQTMQKIRRWLYYNKKDFTIEDLCRDIRMNPEKKSHYHGVYSCIHCMSNKGIDKWSEAQKKFGDKYSDRQAFWEAFCEWLMQQDIYMLIPEYDQNIRKPVYYQPRILEDWENYMSDGVSRGLKGVRTRMKRIIEQKATLKDGTSYRALLPQEKTVAQLTDKHFSGQVDNLHKGDIIKRKYEEYYGKQKKKKEKDV